jgi:hypothetical protein
MALDGIPSQNGPDRDKWMLDAISDGRGEATYADITIEEGGHTLVCHVFADAFKIDGVRINVSAELEQQIADLYSCYLLTPKLADLVFLQRATTLVPLPMPITSSTAAMISESQKIDAAASKASYSEGILQTVGKHWCLSNKLWKKPGFAVNYGWHFLEGSFGMKGERAVTLASQNGHNLLVIQGPWQAHNYRHSDYSQNCVLVSRSCLLDGNEVDLGEILQDPSLAPLVSTEGPLQGLRLPGVTELDPLSPPVKDEDKQGGPPPASPAPEAAPHSSWGNAIAAALGLGAIGGVVYYATRQPAR